MLNKRLLLLRYVWNLTTKIIWQKFFGVFLCWNIIKAENFEIELFESWI